MSYPDTPEAQFKAGWPIDDVLYTLFNGVAPDLGVDDTSDDAFQDYAADWLSWQDSSLTPEKIKEILAQL